MDEKTHLNHLRKYMDYVVGNAPDEFGLIPDDEGFIKIKDLLKAMHEEKDLRYIRMGHLKELCLFFSPPLFEMDENRIRATLRDRLPKHTYAAAPPKLLFTTVRQKAYPHIAEKGILPTHHAKIVMSDQMEMARRVGKRYDATPILLTVNVQDLLGTGAMLTRYGEHLFLTDYIPPPCFRGPSLPKEKESIRKSDAKSPSPVKEPKTPGSFTISPDFFTDPIEKKKIKRERQKKEISWKEERRKNRRR